jgi:hypothetical protein
MFPSSTTAYRVTLPDGTTFFAANIHVLAIPKAESDASALPDTVLQYLMDTNTFMSGYAFLGLKPRDDSTASRIYVRFYVSDAQQFAPRPLVFTRVGRDQVDGDDDSPVEFTEDELGDDSLIQTMLVASLTRPDMDANLEDKVRRGYTRLNT